MRPRCRYRATDVVLVSCDLGGVPNAIALSKATIRNIKQNCSRAFTYNALLIPVAMTVETRSDAPTNGAAFARAHAL